MRDMKIIIQKQKRKQTRRQNRDRTPRHKSLGAMLRIRTQMNQGIRRPGNSKKPEPDRNSVHSKPHKPHNKQNPMRQPVTRRNHRHRVRPRDKFLGGTENVAKRAQQKKQRQPRRSQNKASDKRVMNNEKHTRQPRLLPPLSPSEKEGLGVVHRVGEIARVMLQMIRAKNLIRIQNRIRQNPQQSIHARRGCRVSVNQFVLQREIKSHQKNSARHKQQRRRRNNNQGEKSAVRQRKERQSREFPQNSVYMTDCLHIPYIGTGRCRFNDIIVTISIKC